MRSLTHTHISEEGTGALLTANPLLLTVCAQETFSQMIRDSGLRCVQHTNLTNGVVAIHSAVKLGGFELRSFLAVRIDFETALSSPQ
eukprot:6184422-Pleurochrysis_carterae.AAC.1